MENFACHEQFKHSVCCQIRTANLTFYLTLFNGRVNVIPSDAEDKGGHKPCSCAPPCCTHGKSNCSIPSSILIHVFL